jgi:hypothetical protein
MYYAQFDSQGNYIAGYKLGISCDSAPEGAIEIPDEDWQKYIENGGQKYRRGADGKPEEKPAYVPTLDELKTGKWEQIKAKRDAIEQSGVPYMGKILDSDPLSVQRIAIAVQAAQEAIKAGQPLTLDWTCADNTVLTMTAEQVCGIPVALAQHSDGLHQIARGLSEDIFGSDTNTGATTAEELQAIIWPE